MLVLIADMDLRPLDAAYTKADLLRWRKEIDIETIGPRTSKPLGEILNAYPGAEVFITLYAGERASLRFLHRLEEQLRQLPDSAAGILAVGEGQDDTKPSRGPLAWKRKAVLGAVHGLISDNPALARYLFTELYAKLSRTFVWGILDAEGLRPSAYRQPRWRRAGEEWAAIRPLLLSDDHAGHAGFAEKPVQAEENSPYFTIALCTYNDGAYLPGAIRSVLRQTDPDWELVIVDDGSQDGTDSLLQEWTEHPRIRIFRQAINSGKPSSLNKALQEAKGKRLLELDADDWLAPDCLAAMRSELAADQERGCLVGGYYEWRERSDLQLVYERAVLPPDSGVLDSWLSQGRPVAPRCYAVAGLRELGGWRGCDSFQARLYEDIAMVRRFMRLDSVGFVRKPIYHRRLRSASVTHRGPQAFDRWQESLQQE